jgi:hypothetical protein
MSTKIYKGFRLKTDSFQEALQIVNSFRPWVEKQAELVLDTFIENANDCRKETTDDKVKEKVDAWMLWSKLRQEIVRDKQMRMPHIDTDFSVTLIPSNGQVLGICYTEHYAWYQAWCNHPGVEEYAYWDNTDEPEGMDYEQWEARGKDWEILNWDPVCLQGFSIDLVDQMGPMPKGMRGE